MNAAGLSFTLVLSAAALKWRHGTARTRHHGHRGLNNLPIEVETLRRNRRRNDGSTLQSFTNLCNIRQLAGNVTCRISAFTVSNISATESADTPQSTWSGIAPIIANTLSTSSLLTGISQPSAKASIFPRVQTNKAKGPSAGNSAANSWQTYSRAPNIAPSILKTFIQDQHFTIRFQIQRIDTA